MTRWGGRAAVVNSSSEMAYATDFSALSVPGRMMATAYPGMPHMGRYGSKLAAGRLSFIAEPDVEPFAARFENKLFDGFAINSPRAQSSILEENGSSRADVVSPVETIPLTPSPEGSIASFSSSIGEASVIAAARGIMPQSISGIVNENAAISAQPASQMVPSEAGDFDPVGPADMLRMYYATAYTGMFGQAYAALDDQALLAAHGPGGVQFGGPAPGPAMLASLGMVMSVGGTSSVLWSPDDNAGMFVIDTEDKVAVDDEAAALKTLLAMVDQDAADLLMHAYAEPSHASAMQSSGLLGTMLDYPLPAVLESFAPGG